MNCPKCRSVNPAGTRFCGHCGLDLRPSDFPTATLSTSLREIARGSLIAGRYEIIEEIGAGGMGRVFKAYDRRLHEPVAVKIIRPEIGADAQAMERFDNEIRLARRIAHKNVARMFDVGEDEGTSYITMEYVSGEDLRGLIQRIGWLPIAKVLAVGRQIAEGLAEAHALGIIHRDLKPHNIMIDREGNARIMDFGIARFIKTKRMTEVGMLVGTPEYMPPEQIEGGDADARSDVYSLGIILYEMTTGRLPFTGDTPLAVAMKQKGALPAPPRSLNAETPSSLDALILRCLEKKPDKRFPTAAALAAGLAAIEKDLSTAERAAPLPVHRPTRDVTIQFNVRRVITPVAALILLAAAAGGIWWALTRPGAPTAVPADRRTASASALAASAADGPPAGKPAEKEAVAGRPVSGSAAPGSAEAGGAPREGTERTIVTPPAGDQAPPAKATPAAMKPAAAPPVPKPSPAEAALARSRSAWARGDADTAAAAAREALAADSGNAEARKLLEAAERRVDEKAIADLVVLYDQALDGNRLPAFYRTYGSPALAAEVRQDAETVAALFSRFVSSVSGQRLAWSGRDAAEVSFDHKLLGYAKEGEGEQTLFQGRLSWKVEKRQGRWVIASIKTGA